MSWGERAAIFGPALLAFVASYLYCILNYDYILGVGLGWLPSLIVAILAAALGFLCFIWRRKIAGTIVFFGIIVAIPYIWRFLQTSTGREVAVVVVGAIMIASSMRSAVQSEEFQRGMFVLGRMAARVFRRR